MRYACALLAFSVLSIARAQAMPVPEVESTAALDPDAAPAESEETDEAAADESVETAADESVETEPEEGVETAADESAETATEESVETPEAESVELDAVEGDASPSATNTNEEQAPAAVAAEPEASESTGAVEIEDETPDAHTLDRSRHHWRPWASGLFHISLLSDRLTVSTLNIRFGYGVNVGARRGAWGVYGHIEQNLYAETEFAFTARAGTLNIAVGGERFFFRERLRMAAAIGVSVLLSDLALDSAGSVGLFLQLKPAGIRFARRSQVVVQLDLLSVTIAAPVLASPSVIDLQYRTTLAIEWQGST